MTIARLAQGKFAGAVNGGTSSAIDTTGANLILVVTGAFQGSGGTGGVTGLTDNKGNTFAKRIGFKTTTNGYQLDLWECLNPTVGTGHTFTVAGTSSFSSISVAAYSGVATSSAFGASATNFTTSASTSIQPGSLTPSTNGCLVVAGMVLTDGITGSVSINSSYNIAAQTPWITSVTEGSALADLIQTTAGAVNPTWSGFSSTHEVAALAAYYLPAAGGPSFLPSWGAGRSKAYGRGAMAA